MGELTDATEALSSNPRDTESRAGLPGCFFHLVQVKGVSTPPEIRRARGALMSWLVEHDPRSELPGHSDAFATSGYLDDPENRDVITSLWRKQIDLYPDDIRILKNASMLLQTTDRSPVLKQMQRR